MGERVSIAAPLEGFGQRLIESIRARDKSRYQLASETGIPYGTITSYGRGERNPLAQNVVLICESLDVQSDWLLGLVDDDQPPEIGRGVCKFELDLSMKVIRCSRCGYSLPAGTDLRSTRYCGGCGRRVGE